MGSREATMVTIHTSDDILRVLAENPEWKAAVRREILTEELLNLPARFDQFVGKTEQFQSDTQQAIGELRQFNASNASSIPTLDSGSTELTNR